MKTMGNTYIFSVHQRLVKPGGMIEADGIIDFITAEDPVAAIDKALDKHVNPDYHNYLKPFLSIGLNVYTEISEVPAALRISAAKNSSILKPLFAGPFSDFGSSTKIPMDLPAMDRLLNKFGNDLLVGFVTGKVKKHSNAIAFFAEAWATTYYLNSKNIKPDDNPLTNF